MFLQSLEKSEIESEERDSERGERMCSLGV